MHARDGVLWDWAVEAYGRPGVEDACLTLQDRHGQNVPLLLWAVWAKRDDPALAARAAGLAREWDALAVSPLRVVRRSLKPTFNGIADSAREALRQDVKAAELLAERALLQALEAVAPPDGQADALSALLAASSAWKKPAPGDALAVLAAALG